MTGMNLRNIYHYGILYGLITLFAACDQTIHEYPQDGESLVLVELNVDRTPPQYYKALTYDSNGEYTESTLEPTFSEAYTADERLCMRLITELYLIPSSTDRIDKGVLVARREITVERLMEAPQDTLQFHVPAGIYRALTWADYTPISNGQDWHFNTQTLDAIEVDVDHKPQNNHHKSSAAGSSTFSVDFDNSETGNPSLLDETRAAPTEGNVIPIYLERASGRFRLWATDLDEFLAGGNRLEDLRVQIIYKQYISAGYNVDTETPNRFVQTHTMETTPTTVSEDGSVLLVYDYVLTSSNQEDHVLVDVFIYEGDKELNHYQNITIPLQRNRETVIEGPFLTKKIGSGDIGIDDDFDDEIVIVIPD